MADIDALLASLDDEDDDGTKVTALLEKMTKDLEDENKKILGKATDGVQKVQMEEIDEEWEAL